MDPMSSKAVNAGDADGLPHKVTGMDPGLFKAATLGKVDLLKPLLEANKDVLQQLTTNKETCIHIAAGYGHTELIEFILSQCPILVTKTNLVGDTPLHIAARAGHLDILKLLIGCAKNSESSSPRDLEIGRADATEIMRKGNREKDTIMHEAARKRHLEMVKLLIKEDPELLCKTNHVGESPLHVAVEARKLEVIEEMLKAEHCSYKGPNGRTALHAALIHKRPVIAKMLLEKKPELVEEADDNGRTPLHFVSGFGFLYSVRMLLETDISASYFLDKSGSAPIHISSQYGCLDIIKEFVKQRPELKEFLDGRGQNILHIATKSQQLNVVAYIINERGFDGLLNGKDKDGNTPLHEAVITGNLFIVTILVNDKRVDVMALNNKRLSAVDIARSQYEEGEGGRKAFMLQKLLRVAITNPRAYNPRTLRREILNCSADQYEPAQSYKKKGEVLLVVATLVATVTFAAGFTMPGGYDGKPKGMATLLKEKTFRQFVSADASALFFSTVAVILLVLLQILPDNRQIAAALALFSSQVFIAVAVCLMMQAFTAGVNVALDKERLLIYLVSLFGFHVYLPVLALLATAFISLSPMFVPFWVRVYLRLYSWLLKYHPSGQIVITERSPMRLRFWLEFCFLLLRFFFIHKRKSVRNDISMLFRYDK